MTKSAFYEPEENDLKHLERCLQLAEEALLDGDEPFGSVLVAESGEVLFEDRNRVKDGDHTRHPEFEIARWAANNMPADARAKATVYTSGEHCPMCAAAHGWVGLGRIIYINSSAGLHAWLLEWGLQPGPVAPLPIKTVVPEASVFGPVPTFSERGKALYKRAFTKETK